MNLYFFFVCFHSPFFHILEEERVLNENAISIAGYTAL